MSDDVNFEFRGDHLYIRHPDRFTIEPEGLVKFWARLGEECAKYKCKAVLAEANSPSRHMDMQATFESGVNAAEATPHLSLAICFHDYAPDELSEFFKTVARNRGVNVEFFSDADKGLEWLRGEHLSLEEDAD